VIVEASGVAADTYEGPAGIGEAAAAAAAAVEACRKAEAAVEDGF
jgi:hypothetical protein